LEKNNRPLADIMRPITLESVAGQTHLLGENGIIRQMADTGKIANMILWGPPGCGKTTIARALANRADMSIAQMSAVFSGTADIKQVMEAARLDAKIGRYTLLFIDEIHRFNKTQQDTLLPYIEDGTVTFIGATTENPSFALNNALLSRCHIAVLEPLSNAELIELIMRAEKFLGRKLPMDNDARHLLAGMSDGDARFLLNTIEFLADVKVKKITADNLAKLISKRAKLYDKTGDEHYNLISAVHKSLRASDTDAALYWVARMCVGGEDIHYIFRRLTRFAIEDVGLADPNALTLAMACWQTYERLGSPDGELALTELVIYLGTAPKSIANYRAKNTVWRAATESGSLPPPKNILNAPTKMMKNMGYGNGYVYEPETESGLSGQNCLPDGMARKSFYVPAERGFEREIKKRLEYWNKLRIKDG